MNETITESTDGTATVLRRTIEYKFPDKKATGDSLSKHFKLFAPEKHAITDSKGNDLSWL